MKKKLQFSKLFFLLFLFANSGIKAQNGNYLDLSGNCYAEIYNFNTLLPLQTGTISFWFKINDLTYSNILFSMSNKNAVGTNNEFYIAYRNDYHLIQTVTIVTGSTKLDAWTPTNSVNDTQWHNYTCVADNAGQIQIYIDGVLQSLTAGTCCGGTTNDYFFGDVSGINNIKIGALERTSMIYSNSFAIDDFRIWNKALSASEVTTTTSTVSVPPVTNLVLYYDFEQKENLGVGISGTNDVRDETGNTQHADVLCGTIMAGIENITQNDINMNVYPNPATDQLALNFDLKESDNVEIQIYDRLGRICFKKNEKVNGYYSTVINISEFAAGYYTIMVKGEKMISHTKFIKN